jgi:hypothetical protein
MIFSEFAASLKITNECQSLSLTPHPLYSILKSKRAVQVNIEIMRTFVRLRRILASHADLARKLEALEKKYDAQFKVVFDAIRQLMTPPEPERPKKRIGFLVEEPHVPYESSKRFKKQKRR